MYQSVLLALCVLLYLVMLLYLFNKAMAKMKSNELLKIKESFKYASAIGVLFLTNPLMQKLIQALEFTYQNNSSVQSFFYPASTMILAHLLLSILYLIVIYVIYHTSQGRKKDFVTPGVIPDIAYYAVALALAFLLIPLEHSLLEQLMPIVEIPMIH